MIKHGHIPPETIISFSVPENITPCRIDRYVSELFPDYSRTYFQHIINTGGITINGVPTKKPSVLIHPTNNITVQFPPERIVKTEMLIDKTLNVSVIATTEHFMIIHKPAHLLVHAPSTTSTAITLADWIRHHHGDIASVGSSGRPGIIHRLDKETSGIMIITRTNYAHNIIGGLFRNRKIQKTYKAIVAGHPEKEGTITLAIGRDPINRIKMATFNEENILPQFSFPPSLHPSLKATEDTARLRRTRHSKPGTPSILRQAQDERSEDGDKQAQDDRAENQPNFYGKVKVRHAKTDYKVLEYFKDASLIEVKPTTGRTHQIRVHMAALGHPIIGDQLYGKKSPLIDRQALHAENLSFTLEETSYSFSDEIADDFQQLLNNLRIGATPTK